MGWRETRTHDIGHTGSSLMLLGDSLTYGWGVGESSTLPFFLSQKLPDSKTKKKWNVLNRSVPGWSTYDQLKYWRSLENSNIPDAVVINVVMNDFKPESNSTIDAHRAKAIEDRPSAIRSRFFRLTEEWLIFLDLKKNLNIDSSKKPRRLTPT